MFSHMCNTIKFPRPYWFKMLHFNHVCIQIQCWLEYPVLKKMSSFGGFFILISSYCSVEMYFSSVQNFMSPWKPAPWGTFISSAIKQEDSAPGYQLVIYQTWKQDEGNPVVWIKECICYFNPILLQTLAVSFLSSILILFSPWLFNRNITLWTMTAFLCWFSSYFFHYILFKTL